MMTDTVNYCRKLLSAPLSLVQFFPGNSELAWRLISFLFKNDIFRDIMTYLNVTFLEGD